jgi:hypothetical protein
VPNAPRATRPGIPIVVASLSLAFLVALVGVLAAGPLRTNDAWFHLKLGETYTTQGPWPDADPALHTAHEDAPVQHEWLFGAALHVVECAAGFHGLRAVHLLAVLAILGLAYSLFRSESGSGVAACFASAVFLVLTWRRLFQLRPDLVSIPAALLLYRLLLESTTAPSWRRVGAGVALLLVWANLHSLFAIGPTLLAIALFGIALRIYLSDDAPAGSVAEAQRSARRLGAALGLGLLATLLNPRGFRQHLTFFTSSRETAIWSIRDEWTHFNPFAWAHYGDAVGPLQWAVTDVLFAAFGIAIAVGVWRYGRSPSRDSLRAVDPVLLGLGLASVVAILVSVRFLWMAAFPLLFVLRGLRIALARHPRAERSAAWLLAVAALGLAIALPTSGAVRRAVREIPTRPAAYLSTPYHQRKFYIEGVRFLRESGVQGNLFNRYTMGGFLGYWLAPRLRVFIDGRTEHYPKPVFDDYLAIRAQRGSGADETFLDVLDRRGVDLFFGVGIPMAAVGAEPSVYTTAHLEGAPGWTLVSRSVRHAIYLRSHERNRESSERIAAYYAREGVPFDPDLGLDVAAVIESRPDWAAAHSILPRGYDRLVRAAYASSDRRVRDPARELLGLIYFLLGLYEARAVRRADRDRPRDGGPEAEFEGAASKARRGLPARESDRRGPRRGPRTRAHRSRRPDVPAVRASRGSRRAAAGRGAIGCALGSLPRDRPEFASLAGCRRGANSIGGLRSRGRPGRYVASPPRRLRVLPVNGCGSARRAGSFAQRAGETVAV